MENRSFFKSIQFFMATCLIGIFFSCGRNETEVLERNRIVGVYWDLYDSTHENNFKLDSKTITKIKSEMGNYPHEVTNIIEKTTIGQNGEMNTDIISVSDMGEEKIESLIFSIRNNNIQSTKKQILNGMNDLALSGKDNMYFYHIKCEKPKVKTIYNSIMACKDFSLATYTLIEDSLGLDVKSKPNNCLLKSNLELNKNVIDKFISYFNK